MPTGKKLTQEEFIARAKKVHGEKYDYSQVIFTTVQSKVTLKCPLHGAFEQQAKAHVKGSNCPKCHKDNQVERIRAYPIAKRKAAAKTFIERARAVHGERYDYSQVVYKGLSKKVKIRCSTHGYFFQQPNNHLSGNGCFDCGKMANSSSLKLPLSTFIERARAVHGERYDYSVVVYTLLCKRITIICPDHGAFVQRADTHLRGGICVHCAKETVRITGLSLFIERARTVHGEQYDYSEVVYKDGKQKVRITCPAHGIFEQQPCSHLQRRGCPKCGLVINGKNSRLTLPSFITKARAVHGELYDYSQVEYTTAHSLVRIICPDHGEFKQLAHVHQRGHGCPECAKELLRLSWITQASRLNKTSLLYLLQVFSDDELFYKIGITYNSIGQRYAARQSLAGYQYEVLATYASTNASAVYDWEQSILKTFTYLAYTPKQLFAGASECFSTADPILAAMPFGTVFYFPEGWAA